MFFVKLFKSKLELGGMMNNEELKMNRALLKEIHEKKKIIGASPSAESPKKSYR